MLEDLDKTDDEKFLEFFSQIPENEKDQRLHYYIPNCVNKKYTQDWRSYDCAKTNEEVLFKQMVHELLIQSELDPGKGMYSNSDKIFCMMIKVYSGSSLRKTVSRLKELQQLGYLRKVPSFKTIDNFFRDETLIEILDKLITLSSLPLLEFEETGAIDSSGFSLSKYEQWNEYKWGKSSGKERMWRKAHIVCGTKTNIILSVKMSDKKQADSPVFTEIVGDATKYFNMKDITADKAYSSRENLTFAYNLGMMPFIPFKKNTTGRSKGCYIWMRMYKVFKNNSGLFAEHYHKRSNVETCFQMLKQRFGNNLTTKSWVANGIELKVKVLSHNICVLIQEMYELSAKIDFSECINHYKQVNAKGKV